MALSGFDDDAIRQKISEIDSIAEQINNLLNKLASNVSSEVNNAWRGSAANSFRKAWEDVAGAFSSYPDYIQSLANDKLQYIVTTHTAFVEEHTI